MEKSRATGQMVLKDGDGGDYWTRAARIAHVTKRKQNIREQLFLTDLPY